MAENNKTCSICGKGYYICLACKNNKTTPWKVLTDTSEHYKVHQIINGFNYGVFTKEEANEKLKNVDLSDMDSFLPEIKNKLNKIMTSDVIVSKTDENIVEKAVSSDTNKTKKTFSNSKKKSR